MAMHAQDLMMADEKGREFVVPYVSHSINLGVLEKIGHLSTRVVPNRSLVSF